MDPNQGTLGHDEETLPETEPEVIPVCERGGFTITNADEDE